MRFIVLVKATKNSEAGIMPSEAVYDAMADYHEQLAKAGVLLDGNGLRPTAQGFRIKYSGGKKTVIDGPFTEGKELVAGYTVIQVKSEEEAREWARRFPNPDDQEGEIEIRRLYEIEDLGGPEGWSDRFKEMGIASEK
jgi:hypothetical protein